MVDPDYVPYNRQSGANLAFGKEEENRQIEILRGLGLRVKTAPKNVDMEQGIDFWLYSKNGKPVGVDAKRLSPTWNNYSISCSRDLKLSPDCTYFSFRINRCIYFLEVREIESLLSEGHWTVRKSEQKLRNGMPSDKKFFCLSQKDVIELYKKKISF